MGDFALIFFKHDPGSLMDITRPAVVSEPFPNGQDFLFGCRRQIGNAWKASHPAFEIRNDRLNACLLQHDL